LVEVAGTFGGRHVEAHLAVLLDPGRGVVGGECRASEVTGDLADDEPLGCLKEGAGQLAEFVRDEVAGRTGHRLRRKEAPFDSVDSTAQCECGGQPGVNVGTGYPQL
jgi:hypothetical protein